MYHGKYSRTEVNTSVSRKCKPVMIAMLLAVILTVSVGTTIAYIATSTNSIENSFQSSKVACEVMETFSNNVKTDVRVKNTGDTTAYVRMAVIITWQDVYGNVAAVTPVRDTDYTITWNETDWFQKDGYWYCKKPVTPGNLSDILITECKPIGKSAPEGYTLSVQLLASAIQTEPAEAVETAWGVKVGETGLTADPLT